jgi:hypothetical protein
MHLDRANNVSKNDYENANTLAHDDNHLVVLAHLQWWWWLSDREAFSRSWNVYFPLRQCRDLEVMSCDVSRAKTCAKTIHILGLAHKWKGETSRATKSRFLLKLWALDVGPGSDRGCPGHLSAYPSYGSQRARQTRGRRCVRRWWNHYSSVYRVEVFNARWRGGDRRWAASDGEQGTRLSIGFAKWCLLDCVCRRDRRSGVRVKDAFVS